MAENFYLGSVTSGESEDNRDGENDRECETEMHDRKLHPNDIHTIICIQ